MSPEFGKPVTLSSQHSALDGTSEKSTVIVPLAMLSLDARASPMTGLRSYGTVTSFHPTRGDLVRCIRRGRLMALRQPSSAVGTVCVYCQLDAHDMKTGSSASSGLP